MRLVFCVALLSAGIVTMLGGSEANQLYMGSRTVVGVNAAVDTAQTKGWVVVGYDRNFVAVIPRSVDNKDKPEQQDAMSSIACSRLEVKGITIKQFKESIATGEAAQNFATHLGNDPTKIKDFFDCFKNKPVPPPPAPAAPQGGV